MYRYIFSGIYRKDFHPRSFSCLQAGMTDLPSFYDPQVRLSQFFIHPQVTDPFLTVIKERHTILPFLRYPFIQL